MRKPRSDSKLDALDVDQQRQLCEWLLTPGLNYERIKELVLDEFNTSTSGSALSSFYQSYVGAYVLERRRRAVGLAQEVGDELKRQPGQFSQATIDALEQKAFELAQNPMVDPKEVKAIFSLVLKARDQSLQRDKFEIETCEKILQATNDKRTQAIANSNISNAEKIAQLRQTYFADVDALEQSGAVQIPE
jgi:hypothetical protein